MDKNEFLATKVMEWKDNSYGDYYDKRYLCVNTKAKWNPSENIEQAFMLLDKFKDFHIIKDNDVPEEYRFGVEVNGKKFVYGKTLTEAITEAALIASNYYE